MLKKKIQSNQIQLYPSAEGLHRFHMANHMKKPTGSVFYIKKYPVGFKACH